MAKYLKTAFMRNLEIQVIEEKISYGRMLELIQEEVIKNYKADKPASRVAGRLIRLGLGSSELQNRTENSGFLGIYNRVKARGGCC